MSFSEVSSPSHTMKGFPWDITRLFGTPRLESQLMNSSSSRELPRETLRPLGKGSPTTARTTRSAASLSFGTHEIHSLPSSLFSTRCGTPAASSPRFSASCVCGSEYATARVPTGGSPNDRGSRKGSPARPTRKVLYAVAASPNRTMTTDAAHADLSLVFSTDAGRRKTQRPVRRPALTHTAASTNAARTPRRTSAAGARKSRTPQTIVSARM